MSSQNSALRKAEWRERVCDQIDARLEQIVAPFSLRDLYPEVEEETENGELVARREILPHQQRFHDLANDPANRFAKFCLSGGYGSGKSLAVHAQMVYLARTWPGIRLVTVCAYDYLIDEFIWPTLAEVLPDDSPLIKSKSRSRREIVFANGSVWRFRAYGEAAKIRGWKCHVLWIEEAAQIGRGITPKALAIFRALMGRLRAPGNYPRQVYFSQNPEGYNWVWRLFVRDSPDREEPRVTVIEPPSTQNPYGRRFKEYCFRPPGGEPWFTITAGASANVFLPSEYIRALVEACGEDDGLVARMVEGDFTPVNTLVYDWPWFSRRSHVISWEAFFRHWDLDKSGEEPRIPRWWPLLVGIDCGGPSSPWAIEYYVLCPDQETIICIGEIYETGLTWDEVAARIHADTDDWENVEFYIDPMSSQQRQGPNLVNIQMELRALGIATKPPQGYTKSGGILHVRRFLKRDRSQPHPYRLDKLDPETGLWEMGKARLYYIEGACPKNLEEKEVWRYDLPTIGQQRNAEEGMESAYSEKPVDRDDHAQTAEIFMALGHWPLDQEERRRFRRQVETLNEARDVWYGGGRRREG